MTFRIRDIRTVCTALEARMRRPLERKKLLPMTTAVRVPTDQGPIAYSCTDALPSKATRWPGPLNRAPPPKGVSRRVIPWSFHLSPELVHHATARQSIRTRAAFHRYPLCLWRFHSPEATCPMVRPRRSYVPSTRALVCVTCQSHRIGKASEGTLQASSNSSEHRPDKGRASCRVGGCGLLGCYIHP